MRWGKDPWKGGVVTTATIERVVMTRFSETAGEQSKAEPIAFLTFRFTDERGAVVIQERKIVIPWAVPQPGSTVHVAYFPDKLDRIEWDRKTVKAPDPDVPRGWSGGIFAAEDLGGVKPGDRFGRHEPLMMREFIIDPDGDTSDIDAQRALFRTGR